MFYLHQADKQASKQSDASATPHSPEFVRKTEIDKNGILQKFQQLLTAFAADPDCHKLQEATDEVLNDPKTRERLTYKNKEAFLAIAKADDDYFGNLAQQDGTSFAIMQLCKTDEALRSSVNGLHNIMSKHRVPVKDSPVTRLRSELSALAHRVVHGI